MSSQPSQADGRATGTVLRKALGRYHVALGGRTIECVITNLLRKELIYPIADPASLRRRVMGVKEIEAVDPVAVGDQVAVEHGGDGLGVIVEVLPRRNRFSRRAAGAKPLEQVIAANLDLAMPVAPARPDPNWRLVDRYLLEAEAGEVPALICLTKADLLEPDDRELLAEEAQVYGAIGIELVLTSAVTGEGLADLRERLAGRLAVLMGKSGVGKTSLLNALDPTLELKVRSISGKTGKGRHTTTAVEAVELRGGTRVIDTPGMREFALWRVDPADLAWLFPDMRPFLEDCRFGDGCSHTHEPGCAVKEAVQEGRIARRRYESYLAVRG